MSQGPDQPGWQPPSSGWGQQQGPQGQPPGPPQGPPGPPQGPPGPPGPPQQGPSGPQTPPPGWGGQQPPQGPGSWTPPPFNPQAPFANQQGGFGTPPPFNPHQQQPQRGKGVLIAVAGAGAALLLLVAVIVFVVVKAGDGPDSAKKTPQQKGQEAVAGLGKVSGLRYEGSISAGGTTMQAVISVTKAGSASGQLTISGQSVDLMVVDGTAYVRGPESYWKTQPNIGSGAPDYAGKWAKAPASIGAFDFRTKLTPSGMAQALQSAQPLVAPSGAPTAEQVDGVAAIPFEGTDAQFHVTDAAPFRLAKVKSDGGQGYELTVAELPTPDVVNVYTQLKDNVSNGLAGALDPASKIRTTGNVRNSNCTTGGCTVNLPIENNGADVSVYYRAKIWSGPKSNPGPLLGTCNAGTRIVKSGEDEILTCRVSGGGWTKWVKNLKPGSKNNAYTFQGWALVEAVGKTEISGLVNTLTTEQNGL